MNLAPEFDPLPGLGVLGHDPVRRHGRVGNAADLAQVQPGIEYRLLGSETVQTDAAPDDERHHEPVEEDYQQRECQHKDNERPQLVALPFTTLFHAVNLSPEFGR